MKMLDSCDAVKVAHITKALSTDGITNVVLNYSSYLDKKKFKPTIIAGVPILDFHRDTCISNGIDLVEISSKSATPVKYYFELWKMLRCGHYDIVHVHGNSATMAIELIIAMLSGIKIRIAHCHSSSCEHMKAHRILLPIFKHLYTKGYACSELAGKWLFGDDSFDVLPNGFFTSKYIFNNEIREAVRSELNLKDKYVIGNVAGFNPVKNHVFLLNVFEEIASKNKNAVLLLVGTGSMLKQIMQLIDLHPYKDRIIYYGVTNSVERLYNAMDTFVLPSKHEGLGLVLVEAQISGLRCITSDQVPKEVGINNQTVFISLNDNIKIWADEISKDFVGDRQKISRLAYSSANNFDITKSVKKLEKGYYEILKLA